jgi:hypothetical protein
MIAARWMAPLAWMPGRVLWLAAWAALAAATVAIVWLMRTRWREVRPWKKCAILSLWVHVLLALLATTVRIAAGVPGAGRDDDGPIRVALISVDSSALDDVAPPPEAERWPDPAAEPAPSIEPSGESEEPGDQAELTPTAVAPEDSSATAPLIPFEELKPLPPLAPDVAMAAPELLPEPPPSRPSEINVQNDMPPVADEDVQAPIAAANPATRRPEAATTTTTSDVGQFSSVAAINPSLQPSEVNAAPTNASPAAASTGGPSGELVARRPTDGPPAIYAKRFADRGAAVARGGGNPTTERTVRAALAWLAVAQSEDGRWDPKRHGAGQERYILGENRGGAGARADTGISALALLAFLGAGHTHEDGPYADSLRRGLDFLRRSQAANGNLGGDAELFAHMYCHSMATFAVSEACAITGDKALEPIVRKAVAYSLAVQHPADGGWRYRPGDTGDTSQLGWQLMALHSAQLAGIDVPAATWTRVERFLRSVQRGAAGGLASYRPEGPPTRAMTAEALFCRQLLTRRHDGGLAELAMNEARQSLLQEPPGAGPVNLYYWYYATIALHRAHHASPACHAAWQRWNEALIGALVKSQSADGSWPTTCLWGGYGGRVYTTALGAMCLEVYYRYAPDDDNTGVARRDEWQSAPAR